MVRPGLLTATERRREAIAAKSEERRTLRQSILSGNRNIKAKNPPKKDPEEIKREKLKEWKEKKLKRLEEEKKTRKPPFRSYIVVRHTGTSPFNAKPKAPRKVQSVKFIVPKTNTGFNPKLNIPIPPFPTAKERLKKPVKASPELSSKPAVISKVPLPKLKTANSKKVISNLETLISKVAPTNKVVRSKLKKENTPTRVLPSRAAKTKSKNSQEKMQERRPWR